MVVKQVKTRLLGGYKICDKDIRMKTIGTLDKPYLYSITAVQKNQRSQFNMVEVNFKVSTTINTRLFLPHVS